MASTTDDIISHQDSTCRASCNEVTQSAEIFNSVTSAVVDADPSSTSKMSEEPVQWREGHQFFCPITRCTHVSQSQQSCDEHMKSAHEGSALYSLLPCSTCLYVSDCKESAVEHARAHEIPDSVECKRCHFLAISTGDLQSHTNVCMKVADGEKELEKPESSVKAGDMTESNDANLGRK